MDLSQLAFWSSVTVLGVDRPAPIPSSRKPYYSPSQIFSSAFLPSTYLVTSKAFGATCHNSIGLAAKVLSRVQIVPGAEILFKHRGRCLMAKIESRCKWIPPCSNISDNSPFPSSPTNTNVASFSHFGRGNFIMLLLHSIFLLMRQKCEQGLERKLISSEPEYIQLAAHYHDPE
jgi:hypothetical protein